MSEEFSYMQSAIPKAEPTVKTIKLNWAGLNKRHRIASGELSDCMNVSYDQAPCLVTSEQTKAAATDSDILNPLTVITSGDYLYVLYIANTSTESSKMEVAYYLCKIKAPWKTDSFLSYETIKIGEDNSFAVDNDDQEIEFMNTLYNKLIKTGISLKRFVTYSDDNITSEPESTIVISPIYQFDRPKNSASLKITEPRMYSYHEESGAVGRIQNGGSAFESPLFPFLAVHFSRLFASGKSLVGASGYGSYGDWETDLSYITNSSDGYGANHAWISTVQSDDHSETGDITGITTYNDRIILFKQGTTFEIYNNKNPFRISKIADVGAMDGRTVCNVGGVLIFASDTDVYAYTDSGLSSISDKLNIESFDYAVAGTDNKKYYLYAEGTYKDGKPFKNIFVYDVSVNGWSIRDFKTQGSSEKVQAIFYCYKKLYAMTARYRGNVVFNPYATDFYILNDKNYTDQEWFAETDLFCNDTSGSFTITPKKIKNIKTLSEIGAGSSLSIYVLKADEDFVEGVTQPLKTYTNKTDADMKVPINLNVRMKADYGARIRIEGVGYSKVYSMEITYSGGGALNATNREGIEKS